MSTGTKLCAKQSGSALIVGLIMLILLTLFALSSFKLSQSSIEIVGNAQQNNAVVMAANDALQEAVSTTRMFQSPNSVFLKPCTTANTRCYDVNNDGTNDVTVSLVPSPICIQAQTIPNNALDLSVADDAGCIVGTQQTFGIVGSASNASLCASSLWTLNAVAEDKVTQAIATVTEGVTVRVSTAVVATVCP